eukprot:TRINITY_DN111333_c0_g1_i1.p1 TRINITY_DN111333_c0_g1~~TRINITY_DN111333_c0_g1_i1.p1  ORF type:complete len:664 (-),score=208.32 TRINITY_DN111333_c0_g1_i1:343-2334(-)
MARSALSLLMLALVLFFRTSSAEQSRATGGIQRVVQMLHRVIEKAREEIREEEVEHAKRTAQCQMRQDELERAIQAGREQIQITTAEMYKAQGDQQILGKAIEQLTGYIERDTADLEKRTKKREKEHAEYQAERKDFQESSDAVEAAILRMREKNEAAYSFLEIAAQNAGSKGTALLDAYMGSDEEQEDSSSDGASSGAGTDRIMGMLDDLKNSFRDKLQKADKEELTSKFNHETIANELQQSIKEDGEAKKTKAAEKNRKKEEEAEAKKKLIGLKKVEELNVKAKKESEIECSQKESEYREVRKVLKDEQRAVGKAIQLLTGHKVMKADARSGFVQVNSSAGTSFAQLGMRRSVGQADVRAFIAEQAKKLDSQKLSLLAQAMEADPFAKVRSMIEKMISKLMQQAREDAEKDAFCDTEEAKSKMLRTKLTEQLETLNAGIDSGTAAILELKDAIEDLSKEIKECDDNYAKVQELRNEEKKKNEVTLKDAKLAQAAIADAKEVLREFYSGVSFLQTSMTSDQNQKEPPGSRGVAVISMMEIIADDFAKLEADTEAAEANAKRLFADATSENRIEHALKSKQLENNKQDKAEHETKLQNNKMELASSKVQLESAEQYYVRLQKQCAPKTMTYEEAAAKAKKEVASLKLALKMLNVGEGREPTVV